MDLGFRTPFLETFGILYLGVVYGVIYRVGESHGRGGLGG